MMSLVRLTLAACAVVACSLPVSAQEQEQPVVMEELIAMPLQTPPWWTVKDADSEVHVIALPAWTPAGMEWDDTLLFEKIKDAKMVILPRKPLISVNDKPLPGRIGFNMWALPVIAMRGWGQMKDMQTRPPQIAPEHVARLKALEVEIDENEEGDDDDKLNPTARAISVWFKTHERAGLARGEIEEQVEGFAEEHEVKVSEIPSYKISSLDWVIAQTRPADTACLVAALDEAELGSDEVRYAALAWARGRMKPLQELKSSEVACAMAITERKDFARSTIADEVGLLRQALRQKGQSVALIPADHILGDNGVLKRLEGRNIKIEALQETL
jgi:hypothetical protein